MFDIGISEIAVIAVVALVVIGPERLPKVARTVGTLLGRAQRYVNDVKAEVNREMELEELRKLQTQMQDAARGIHEQVTTASAEVQTAMHDMGRQLQDGVAPVQQAADQAAEHLGLAPTPPAEPVADGTAAVASTGPTHAVEHYAAAVMPSDAAVPVPAAAAQAAPPAAHPEPAAPAGPAPEDRPAQSSLFPEHTIR